MFALALIDSMKDVVGCIWHGILCPLDWMFVKECSTAGTLLSMSFAINSIFTGLSISRFNLCEWMKRKALKYIDNSTDDKFLEKVERLGKNNKNILQQLARFSDKVERYRVAMGDNSLSKWELLRRSVTVCCACLAFILVALEIKTRVGFALVCPYIIFLLGHALWVLHRTHSVKKRFKALQNAMDKAEEEKTDDGFDMADCINRLKANHNALSPRRKSKRK